MGLLSCRIAGKTAAGRCWSIATVGIFALTTQVVPQESSDPTAGARLQGQRRPIIERREPSLQIKPENISIVILYDPSETPDTQAEEFAREITVASILSGVKMTKADAARGVSAQGAEETKVSVHDIFPRNPSVAFFAAKQSGGDCVPPPDCGCDKDKGRNGFVDCVCIVWRKNSGDIGCICRLCMLDYPNTSLGSPTGSSNRTVQPKPLICIVLGERLQRDIANARWWENNREFFAQEVWAKAQAAPTTTNLTIKVKSSPR